MDIKMKKKIVAVVCMLSILVVGGVTVSAASSSHHVEDCSVNYNGIHHNSTGIVKTVVNVAEDSFPADVAIRNCPVGNVCVYNTDCIYPVYPDPEPTVDDTSYQPEPTPDVSYQPEPVQYTDTTSYYGGHYHNDACYQDMSNCPEYYGSYSSGGGHHGGGHHGGRHHR